MGWMDGIAEAVPRRTRSWGCGGMDWIAEAMPFFNKNEELAIRVVSHFGEESTKILTIE